jgi:hypothetical protein
MSQTLRVLNLGAGVQSTTLFFMILDGDLPPVDVAIFADTGDEPKAVYEHPEMLKTYRGTKIITVSQGNLGDNLVNGVNSTGQRFVAIPSYLNDGTGAGKTGLGRRQCTSEYKIKPIEQGIRAYLGLAKGERMPKTTRIHQVFGLSFDEPKRVARVKDAFYARNECWQCEFPLFEERMTREDCVVYLQKRLPGYKVPRSACVFCPFKRDSEWIELRDNDPEGWKRAVEIDNAIRMETSVCTRGMNSTQYLHSSCVPLELVQLRQDPPDTQKRFTWSNMDCEGMCGV